MHAQTKPLLLVCTPSIFYFIPFVLAEGYALALVSQTTLFHRTSPLGPLWGFGQECDQAKGACSLLDSHSQYIVFNCQSSGHEATSVNLGLLIIKYVAVLRGI